MRYTKRDATIAFERLCETKNKRVATSYNDVGAWQLDCNHMYGGYRIEEIVNDSGGIKDIINIRMNTAHFIKTCQSIIEVDQSK